MASTEAVKSTIPDLETIRAAHARIKPHIHRTPVVTSHSLDEISGARLFFKCENLQRTGSFKIRGATNAVFSLSESDAARGVVTHSSGNHAAALASAAKSRGIQAWVVMPKNAPKVKAAAVEAYGGKITYCEPTLESRESTCAEIQSRTGAILIHPFDDDRIIAGQGTAALELVEEIPDLDFIVAPVSGGGLLSGTMIAARGVRPQIRAIGAEPANADDAYRSIHSGHIAPASKTTTIADGLRATLSPRTFAIFQKLIDDVALVSEDEIVSAMRLLWERLKLVVEPSGAVSAATAIHHKFDAKGARIGIILSGGNVDLSALPFR